MLDSEFDSLPNIIADQFADEPALLLREVKTSTCEPGSSGKPGDGIPPFPIDHHFTGDSIMPNDVTLDPNGGTPSINLRFGFGQFAKFRIFLWDQSGQNPKQIVLGTNLPGAEDSFSLELPASNLIGRFLTWDALISSPTGASGQQYSMTATFSQDNNTIPNTTFTRSGSLNGASVDMDQAKFVSST